MTSYQISHIAQSNDYGLRMGGPHEGATTGVTESKFVDSAFRKLHNTSVQPEPCDTSWRIPVSSMMFPHLALRALPLVRFGRLWVIMTGILFVAYIILRHISTGIEDYASGADYWRSYWMGSSVRNSHQQLSHALAFSKTYVISLPRRADRRAQMDLLKDALHIDWTYMDAVEANSSTVTTILRQVYILRSQVESRLEHGLERVQENAIFSVFDWPRDIEAVVHSQGPLRPYGADFWILPSSQDSTSLADPLTSAHIPSAQPVATVDPPPLACASGNNISATFSSNLPFYRHLTAAKPLAGTLTFRPFVTSQTASTKPCWC